MKLPHQLKNAITTYSITLMDIMKIRYLSEKQPDTSVLDAGITPLECEILYTYANKKGCTKIRFDKDDPPTIWEFCRVLGTIGGFIPSKRQPLPGLKILSRALQTYYVLLDAYDAYMSKN